MLVGTSYNIMFLGFSLFTSYTVNILLISVEFLGFSRAPILSVSTTMCSFLLTIFLIRPGQKFFLQRYSSIVLNLSLSFGLITRINLGILGAYYPLRDGWVSICQFLILMCTFQFFTNLKFRLTKANCEVNPAIKLNRSFTASKPYSLPFLSTFDFTSLAPLFASASNSCTSQLMLFPLSWLTLLVAELSLLLILFVSIFSFLFSKSFSSISDYPDPCGSFFLHCPYSCLFVFVFDSVI